MDVIQVHDLLNINEDSEILSLLKNEKLYFSDVITKINHYGLSQERSIILTDIALYNMKKKELKRRIPYKEILGITYSTLSNEFVIHGNNCQYDYHYNSQNKILVISLIAFFYDEKNNSQINLCEVPEKSLKNFVTSKKEKQKDSNYSRMDKKYLIDTSEFQENNMEFLFFGNDNDNDNVNININSNQNNEKQLMDDELVIKNDEDEEEKEENKKDMNMNITQINKEENIIEKNYNELLEEKESNSIKENENENNSLITNLKELQKKIKKEVSLRKLCNSYI